MTHVFSTRLARHEEEAACSGAGAAGCLGLPSRGRGRPRWRPGACLAMAKARASWQPEAARLHDSPRESGGVRAGSTSAQPDLQSYILHGTAACWSSRVRQASSTYPRPPSCPRRPTHPARAHIPRHQASSTPQPRGARVTCSSVTRAQRSRSQHTVRLVSSAAARSKHRTCRDAEMHCRPSAQCIRQADTLSPSSPSRRGRSAPEGARRGTSARR